MRYLLLLPVALAVAAAPASHPDLDRPQHSLTEPGDTLVLNTRNLLPAGSPQWRHDKGDGNFHVSKPAGEPGDFYRLRHVCRVRPLTRYILEGELTLRSLKGPATLLRVEFLDANREEFGRAISVETGAKPGGQATPFRFAFDTDRRTHWIRVWIAAERRAAVDFSLGGLRLTQVSESRAVETAALATRELNPRDSIRQVAEVPEGATYLRLTVRTRGLASPRETGRLLLEVTGPADTVLDRREAAWRTALATDGKPAVVYATWRSRMEGPLDGLPFQRDQAQAVPATAVQEWPLELALHEGSRQVVLQWRDEDAGSENSFQLLAVTVAAHRDPEP